MEDVVHKSLEGTEGASSPNGIIRNWKRLLPGPGLNAIFSTSAVLPDTCFNPLTGTVDPAPSMVAVVGKRP